MSGEEETRKSGLGGMFAMLLGLLVIAAIFFTFSNLLDNLTGNSLRREEERTAQIRARADADAQIARANAEEWKATMQALATLLPLVALVIGGWVILGLVLTHWARVDAARRDHEIRLLELLAERQRQQQLTAQNLYLLPAPRRIKQYVEPVEH